jgi:hypothetical protein
MTVPEDECPIHQLTTYGFSDSPKVAIGVWEIYGFLTER